jgi:hypothetical protein
LVRVGVFQERAVSPGGDREPSIERRADLGNLWRRQRRRHQLAGSTVLPEVIEVGTESDDQLMSTVEETETPRPGPLADHLECLHLSAQVIL